MTFITVRADTRVLVNAHETHARAKAMAHNGGEGLAIVELTGHLPDDAVPGRSIYRGGVWDFDGLHAPAEITDIDRLKVAARAGLDKILALRADMTVAGAGHAWSEANQIRVQDWFRHCLHGYRKIVEGHNRPIEKRITFCERTAEGPRARASESRLISIYEMYEGIIGLASLPVGTETRGIVYVHPNSGNSVSIQNTNSGGVTAIVGVIDLSAPPVPLVSGTWIDAITE